MSPFSQCVVIQLQVSTVLITKADFAHVMGCNWTISSSSTVDYLGWKFPNNSTNIFLPYRNQNYCIPLSLKMVYIHLKGSSSIRKKKSSALSLWHSVHLLCLPAMGRDALVLTDDGEEKRFTLERCAGRCKCWEQNMPWGVLSLTIYTAPIALCQWETKVRILKKLGHHVYFGIFYQFSS